MYTKLFLIITVLAGLLRPVVGQLASLYGCVGGIYDDSNLNGNTYYYASDDQEVWGTKAHTQGTCPEGQYLEATLFTADHQSYPCDNLPADGQSHLVTCPGVTKGSLAAGSAILAFDDGTYIVQEYFTVSHTQSTTTAPTPTQTVVNTPTETATSTVTVTNTVTYTSNQVTVTSPSSTMTNTITVTPKSTVTSTATRTITFTLVKQYYSVTKATVTSALPCPSGKPKLCLPTPKRARRSPSRIDISALRARAAEPVEELVRRAANSRGPEGDGPLTTTITPDPVIASSTAPAVTTTATITTEATSDATTTVANPTPTFTYYTGNAVSAVTTTIPPKTRTKTRYAFTVAVTTTTKTYTFTKTKLTGPTGCNR